MDTELARKLAKLTVEYLVTHDFEFTLEKVPDAERESYRRLADANRERIEYLAAHIEEIIVEHLTK